MNTASAFHCIGIILEKRGHTGVVTLDNPPAHTWTVDSLAALARLVGDLNQDRDIYALVITGGGEKFFSAGADLKLFADGDKGKAVAMARRFGEAFEALAGFTALVGGGCAIQHPYSEAKQTLRCSGLVLR